jgi:glycosyltransferase involved in cell wall biosynthesis
VSPRVSIVIPTYNNADYVESMMQSVLEQTYTDSEIVIADHASADNTWELLQKYADHPAVTLLRTEAGGGAKRNWQRVTDAASGELIKLVCADDLIYPTCVAEQVDALDAAPEAVLAACARDIVDADGRIVVRSRGLGGMQGVVDGRHAVRRAVRLGTNIFGEPACVLMRRQNLVDVGGWDDTYPYLIDQATYSKVLLTGAFAAVPRTLAAFRVNAAQWSVRLAGVQARQAAGMHRSLHEADPDLVSRLDVSIGDARATITALMRRSAYAYLRRRMNRSAHAD